MNVKSILFVGLIKIYSPAFLPFIRVTVNWCFFYLDNWISLHRIITNYLSNYCRRHHYYHQTPLLFRFLLVSATLTHFSSSSSSLSSKQLLLTWEHLLVNLFLQFKIFYCILSLVHSNIFPSSASITILHSCNMTINTT